MWISRLALTALLPSLLLQSFATSITFPPTGIGAGAASTDLSSFGFSSSTGGVSSAGVGSTGGPHNSANLLITSNEDTGLTASPDANALPILNSLGLSTVARPVPYQAGTAIPAPTVSSGETKRIKRKIKRAVSPAEAPVMPPPVQNTPDRCWVVKKQCCWTEVNHGYKCRDFYQHKYARCHPVIDYKEHCEDEMHEPKHHPKPDRKTKFEETIIKNYDPNYGPHVQGYPQTGESELYFTEDIPARPHGVSGEPFAPLPPAPAPVPPTTAPVPPTTAPVPSATEAGGNGGYTGGNGGYVGGNGGEGGMGPGTGWKGEGGESGEVVTTTTVTSESTGYVPGETGVGATGDLVPKGSMGGGGNEAPVTPGVAYTPRPTAGPPVGGEGVPSYTGGGEQGGDAAGRSYRR